MIYEKTKINNELSKEKQKEYIDKFCEKYKISFVGEDIFRGNLFDFYHSNPDRGRMCILPLFIETIIYDIEADIKGTTEQLIEWRLYCRDAGNTSWSDWIKNGN